MPPKHILRAAISALALSTLASAAFAQQEIVIDDDTLIMIDDPMDGTVIDVGVDFSTDTGEAIDPGVDVITVDEVIYYTLGEAGGPGEEAVDPVYYELPDVTLDDGALEVPVLGTTSVDSACGGCEYQNVAPMPNERDLTAAAPSDAADPFAAVAASADNMCNYSPFSALAACESWRSAN